MVDTCALGGAATGAFVASLVVGLILTPSCLRTVEVLRLRSGFRQQAPDSLTPANCLKFKSRRLHQFIVMHLKELSEAMAAMAFFAVPILAS